MDTGERPQGTARRAGNLRESQIELDYLIPFSLAAVLHVDIDAKGIARIQRGCRQLEIAVFEFRVAEPVAERIKRLPIEISIGAVLHGIVFERGKLLDTLIEGDR